MTDASAWPWSRGFRLNAPKLTTALKSALQPGEKRLLRARSIAEKRAARAVQPGQSFSLRELHDQLRTLECDACVMTPPLAKGARRTVQRLAALMHHDVHEKGAGDKRKLVITNCCDGDACEPDEQQVLAAERLIESWESDERGGRSNDVLDKGRARIEAKKAAKGAKRQAAKGNSKSTGRASSHTAQLSGSHISATMAGYRGKTTAMRAAGTAAAMPGFTPPASDSEPGVSKASAAAAATGLALEVSDADDAKSDDGSSYESHASAAARVTGDLLEEDDEEAGSSDDCSTFGASDRDTDDGGRPGLGLHLLQDAGRIQSVALSGTASVQESGAVLSDVRHATHESALEQTAISPAAAKLKTEHYFPAPRNFPAGVVEPSSEHGGERMAVLAVLAERRSMLGGGWWNSGSACVTDADASSKVAGSAPAHTVVAPIVVADPSLIGEWEGHTRGFGSRLLAKMGYRGGILGRRDAAGAPLNADARTPGAIVTVPRLSESTAATGATASIDASEPRQVMLTAVQPMPEPVWSERRRDRVGLGADT
jgi:hypothetical protein